MNDDDSYWMLVPQPVRKVPADIVAIIALVVLTNVAIFVPVINETHIRVVVGLVFVLFVPGYAFTAALYPRSGDSDVIEEFEDGRGTTEKTPTQRGISGIERIVYSLGLSVAIVPLVGIVLNYTPLGIQLVPIVVSLSGITIIATVVAVVRRENLPTEEQFYVPYKEWIATGRLELLELDSRADAVVSVIVIAALLFAVGMAAFAMTTPPDGDRYSALYLLSEDDDGTLVAEGFQTDIQNEKTIEVIVGVDNAELRTINYTIVSIEQDIDIGDDNESVITDQRELDQFETELEHDETWHHTHEIDPSPTSENVRIVWLLYIDDVPDEPTLENADQRVQLLINTTAD